MTRCELLGKPYFKPLCSCFADHTIATINFRSERGLMLPSPFLKFRIVHLRSIDRPASLYAQKQKTKSQTNLNW